MLTDKQKSILIELLKEAQNLKQLQESLNRCNEDLESSKRALKRYEKLDNGFNTSLIEKDIRLSKTAKNHWELSEKQAKELVKKNAKKIIDEL